MIMDAVEKNKLRQDINLLALSLIVYTFVSYTVVTGELMLRMLLARIVNNTVSEQLMRTAGESVWSQIVAVIAGIVVMALFSRGSIRFSSLFQVKKRMPFTVYIELLCVICAFQPVAEQIDRLLEYCLNLIGFTLSEGVAQATSVSDNPSRFLYACLVAPLAEEIVFRGFCLRRLPEHGRVFAIVISALLFGITHANPAQMPFAFFVGLVLGFVATEYAIHYAILLHVTNNLVFGDLLSFAYTGAPEALFMLVLRFLFGMFFFCAVLVLIRRRKEIVSYIRAQSPPAGAYRCAFTAALLLVLIAMNVALSLFLITPLQS